MKRTEYGELTHALRLAEQEAMKFANVDDGGTSNFDAPYIILKGTSEKTLDNLFGGYYGVHKFYGWKDAYVIGYRICKGQGNRNTKMAEAFSRKLSELGYNSGVRYLMD